MKRRGIDEVARHGAKQADFLHDQFTICPQKACEVSAEPDLYDYYAAIWLRSERFSEQIHGVRKGAF
jgi:hypothetical protein